MAISPEIDSPKPSEAGSGKSPDVVERQENMEIAPELERAKVQRRPQDPSDVQAHVTDDDGQPITQSPATQQVTVQVPATQSQLSDWSKGSITNSLTWFARFWLRVIKKAARAGKRIVVSGDK